MVTQGCQTAYRVAPAGLHALLLFPDCPMRMCGEPGSYIPELGAVLCPKHQEISIEDEGAFIWRHLPRW